MLSATGLDIEPGQVVVLTNPWAEELRYVGLVVGHVELDGRPAAAVLLCQRIESWFDMDPVGSPEAIR